MKITKKLVILLTLAIMMQSVFMYCTVYAESARQEKERETISSSQQIAATQNEANPLVKSIDLNDLMGDLKEKQQKNILQAENPEIIKRDKQAKNSPNDAPEVLADTIYSASLLGTNDAVWMRINTDNYKKLTTVVQFLTNMDFSIQVYQLDASSTLQYVQGTDVNLLFTNNDRVSFLPQGGWYYIAVTSLGGSGTFNFLLQSSDSYGSHEPNDNYFQAPQFQTEINTSDTFDNLYDDDWYKLSVPKEQTYYFSVNMREEPFGVSAPVNLYILDMTNGGVSLLQEETPFWYSISLPKGEYAFAISSGTEVSLNREYIFNMLPEDSKKLPTEVHIQKIGDNPFTTFIFEQTVWRVMGPGSMVVYGSVDGTDLSYVGNMPIQLKITATNILGLVKEIQAAGTATAENGTFRLTIKLPYCDGMFSGTSKLYPTI